MLKIIFTFLFIIMQIEANTITFISDETYTPEYKIHIDVKIEDRAKLTEARVYFKTDKEKPYQVYAPMKCNHRGLCRGYLSIPLEKTKNIYCKVIYLNKVDKVYASERFEMQKVQKLILGNNQSNSRSTTALKTDFKIIPKLRGFKNFSIAKIKKSKKIGVVAGLISERSAGIKNASKEIRGRYYGRDFDLMPLTAVGTIILMLLVL